LWKLPAGAGRKAPFCSSIFVPRWQTIQQASFSSLPLYSNDLGGKLDIGQPSGSVSTPLVVRTIGSACAGPTINLYWSKTKPDLIQMKYSNIHLVSFFIVYLLCKVDNLMNRNMLNIFMSERDDSVVSAHNKL
jgi:hypothetical protein